MHLENHKAKNLSYEQEVTAKGMFKYIITPKRGDERGGGQQPGYERCKTKGEWARGRDVAAKFKISILRFSQYKIHFSTIFHKFGENAQAQSVRIPEGKLAKCMLMFMYASYTHIVF